MRTPTDRGGFGVVAWLCLGATMTAVALMTAVPRRSDFGIIYDSARALLSGLPAYMGDNLNPPTVSLALAPVFFLPLSIAWIAWTALGGACIALSLVIARRTGALPNGSALWILGACGTFTGSSFAWHEGQVTWILLLLVTAAWAYSRRGHVLAAGVWLGIATAFKPPLIIAVICLPLAVSGVAAATAAALVVLGALATGPAPWLQWMARGRAVTWVGQPMNASWWGIAARAISGKPGHFGLAQFGPVTVAAIVAVTAVMMWRAARSRHDERWTLALLTSIAASPLGWAYYLPLAFFPAAASWRRFGLLAVVLFCAPLPFPWPATSPWLTNAVGLIYPAGLAVVWIAWSSSPPRRRQAILVAGIEPVLESAASGPSTTSGSPAGAVSRR